MPAPSDTDTARLSFFEIVAAELAPREGRWAAVLRIATATTLTVVVAMIFRIPEPTYMAYIVFLVSKDDRGGTLKAALGGFAAAATAVIVTLILSLVDMAAPALRVPAMAITTFLAMYTTRVFALGPLTYLVGFVIVLLHTLIDDVPAPEYFTRATLWVLVIIGVPVFITIMTQTLFGHGVEISAQRVVRKVLGEWRSSHDDRRHLPRWRAELAPYAGHAAVDNLLEQLTAGAAAPTIDELVAARTSAPAVKKPWLAADAFSNPAHWQFALKTTVAVMAAYGIYTLLDWPGIRTAVVTCFFVALASLGETLHKLLLRLSGALLGGLSAGLCIVYVLPHMTDIGQLCVLIAAACIGAGWLATCSELLSYAGLQTAFAFFLGILQGYAPATDLTVLRDRIAGIVLGNVLVTIVFSTLWPESARSRMRAALLEATHALQDVLAGMTGARRRAIRALTEVEHFETLSVLELRMLGSDDSPAASQLERLTGAVLTATDPLDRQKLQWEIEHVAAAAR